LPSQSTAKLASAISNAVAVNQGSRRNIAAKPRGFTRAFENSAASSWAMTKV
jgi:hypothetical protein